MLLNSLYYTYFNVLHQTVMRNEPLAPMVCMTYNTLDPVAKAHAKAPCIINGNQIIISHLFNVQDTLR